MKVNVARTMTAIRVRVLKRRREDIIVRGPRRPCGWWWWYCGGEGEGEDSRSVKNGDSEDSERGVFGGELELLPLMLLLLKLYGGSSIDNPILAK